MVRNISSASEYGIGYSNSVRLGPRLRLFSVIVALESEMRTLALFPLLLADKGCQHFARCHRSTYSVVIPGGLEENGHAGHVAHERAHNSTAPSATKAMTSPI